MSDTRRPLRVLSDTGRPLRVLSDTRRPLRVLTWHVHGSYLLYLSRTPHTLVLPVREGRPEGYGGRGGSFAWPDSVVEVRADEVATTELDVVLTQSRRNWETDRHDLLPPDRLRDLPAVHLEHDPPPGWPNDARHPVQDEHALLVHVTPFNSLMWDAGVTPSTVVEHGVQVPADAPAWTGEHAAAVTVVNNLWSRGRRLGPDVFERAAAELPVDLAGMGGARYPRWLGDVALADLHRRLPAYRAFFHPIRYTSLGLALCEAMMLGLPVVGLATTETAAAVRQGVDGWTDTSPARVVEHLRRLLTDHDEAAALSVGAARRARERYGIERFAADWDALLRAVVDGRAVPPDGPRAGRRADDDPSLVSPGVESA